MNLVVPLLLSGSGVAVAIVAFHNRYNPAWHREMPRIYIIALGQVALGAMSWFLLSR
jgi:hypothetical protein